MRVLPWHLHYNWEKSTEKPQSGMKNLSQVKKNLSHYKIHTQVKKNLSHYRIHTHTRTHTHTPTHTHTHFTKQYKTTTVQIETNTVQGIPKWHSHSIIKRLQYKVTLMYIDKNFTDSLHFPYLHNKNTSYESRQFTPVPTLHFTLLPLSL
jgi:hypothetical protein